MWGKQIEGDVDVWLFVKLNLGVRLSEEQNLEIKKTIRANTTPRHVPKKIIQIADIPYTSSGKKMELVVSKIINGKPITNIGAIANPESIKEYQGCLNSGNGV